MTYEGKQTILQKLFLTVLLLLIIIFLDKKLINAQTPTPTPTITTSSSSSGIPECAERKLNNDQCIEYLKNRVSEKEREKKTLSSQIAVMDGQIKLTEFRINATKEEISDLTLDIDTAAKKISTLEESLAKFTGVLINRIVATYEVGRVQTFHVFLSSNNVSNFFSRLNYLKIAQEHDKKLIYDTTQARNDYANQKQIFEDKKKKVLLLQTQLKEYTKQLEQDKQSKQALLDVTKNDEVRYQRLLQQAQAERAIVFGGGTDAFVREVNQGDSIGSIASRSISPGCSTGAHLHFELQKNGSIQNPNSYLKQVSYSYSYPSEQYGYYGTINPTGDLSWPLSEPVIINQGYGSHGFAQTFYPGGTHTGIDMDSSSSAVKAVKAGKLYGGSYNCTNGKLYYAKVLHDDGLTSWYLHMIPN